MRKVTLKKYGAVVRVTLANFFEYKTNFLVGRARSVILLLTLYYLWITVFGQSGSLFGYSLSQILTYVLLVQILRALVLNSRTDGIAWDIHHGSFISFLLRPISHIGYWFSLDLVYKFFEVVAAILEVWLLAWFFRIPFIWPANPPLFVLSALLAIFLYFLIGYLVSLTAFWALEAWGPRFALGLFLEFSAGAFFPLDVLPPALALFFRLLPFYYLVFFPANIWLGRLAVPEVAIGFLAQALWLIFLWFLVRFVWAQGLRIYSAEGG